jgi:hypothetical protein
MRRLLNTAAYNWAFFLARPEGVPLTDVMHGPSCRAILAADQINADPLERALAERQKKALRDRQVEPNDARVEGGGRRGD